jgi:hypothetical protein
MQRGWNFFHLLYRKDTTCSSLERFKKNAPDGKRPGSVKRNKAQALEIHDTKVIALAAIPEGIFERELGV